MKNKHTNVGSFGLLAIVAVIGFSFAACDNGGGGGGGTPTPEDDTAINIAAIAGVTVPATGAAPVTAITSNDQYTGTVAWNGAPAAFAASTAYTATITLTAKSGYTLQGVAANFFTVAGTTSVSNAANSGVVTAVFPQTTASGGGITPHTTHTYGEWVPTTPATFFATGVGVRKCTVCDEPDPNTIIPQLPITTAEDWSAAITQIGEEQNTGTYTIEIGGDFSVAGIATAYTFGTTASGSTLTVTINGNDHEISLSSNGYLLSIDARQSVTMNSLNLKGKTDNNRQVVYIGGTAAAFIMNSGTISDNNGGGVSIYSGTFTMNGGEISGNTASNGGGVNAYNTGCTFNMKGGTISGNTAAGTATGSSRGGGVYISSATFTMSGGTISGNTASEGGGVFMRRDNYVTSTMSGGTISDNTATSNGGGVYVYTIPFNMTGGTISGNNASGTGGGVYVYSSLINKTGGTIYGSDAAEDLRNTATQANGQAVYASVAPARWRNTTAGVTVNLNSSTTTTAENWGQ